MVKLYLLRHGVAYEREEWTGESDELRPLTDDGIDAMKREAKSIRVMKLKLDVLVSSPLVRARDTAKIVARTLDLKVNENDLLRPGFDLEALRALLQQHSGAKRIMIVGHEPDFSIVIAQLIGGGTVVMRKGGLARVDVTVQGNSLRGELVWLLTPSLLSAR
jgi:phosphohistidine phosphatase